MSRLLSEFLFTKLEIKHISDSLGLAGSNVKSAKDSLGGPIPGTRWMVEEARDRGFKLGAGTLLILGTCGKALPATPADYLVSFGELGEIKFSIT